MGSISPACFAFLGLEPVAWWWILGGLALFGVIFYFFHYTIVADIPLWILRHTFYRVHGHGLENIPKEGPALLVSNHISHIDAMVIMAASQRRIRFIIWAPYVGLPIVGWILKLGKVIPINSSTGPRAIIQALRQASEALAQGELVCIFAEGGITRTGFLLPFQRGFEQIVKKTPAPIIPVCLDHIWGSVFSFRGGRFFWKWPKQIPYHVHVNFGAALPATASPPEVRQAIQRLSAESAIRRASERLPVHRQFVRVAARHPFRPCFVDPNNSTGPVLSYGKVLTGAKILLKRLRPLLGDEPMVGLWLPPSAGGAIANIIVAFLRKTAVNLNYTASPEIVRSSIRQCGIKHVLTSKLFAHKVPLDPGPGVELIYLEDFRKDITSWERIRTLLSVLLMPRWIQEYWLLGLGKHNTDDLACIIFSSGSTGDPKGVMLTHANIAANVESMIQAIDLTPKDRLFGILPFFHSFGYTVTLWAPLQVAASTIFFPDPRQAREIGELCKKYQSTIFLSTPTFLRFYIRRCEPDEFRSVRILMCGAEKLPQPLAQEFFAKFGVLPLEGYGCTELSPAAVANVPDFEQDNVRQKGNKAGTIGQPLPGVAARIVNKETFEDLPIGEEGLLLISGANVMKGYLGRDDLTEQKIIQGGWYITGDLARADEEGFITITGREERFAKVGGEMVPLERVEDEMHAALESSDRLLAVTAIPDEKKGEKIIVLHLPFEQMEISQLLKKLGERLPNLYIPGQRDFFQVEELPILGSGKLDLKRCKQTALDLANPTKAESA